MYDRRDAQLELLNGFDSSCSFFSQLALTKTLFAEPGLANLVGKTAVIRNFSDFLFWKRLTRLTLAGKARSSKIAGQFDLELQSAVDEIEQDSDKKEFSLPHVLTLNCDAAGYIIGDGEAIFIFSALYDP